MMSLRGFDFRDEFAGMRPSAYRAATVQNGQIAEKQRFLG